MKSFIPEASIEDTCLDYFRELGWQVLHGPEIGPGEPAAERASYREGLLEGRLRAAIGRLNPGLSPEQVEGVIGRVRQPESGDVLAENWRIYRLLTQGVAIEGRTASGEIRHTTAWLVDWEHPDRNDWVVVNQFSVEGDRSTRRPDIVAFVNGVPLTILELKAPGEERATLRGAFDQLRTYAAEIPALLRYSAVSVISTGTQARMGPLGGPFEHFAPWKRIEGPGLAPRDVPELTVLIRGVFAPARFLDLVRNFIVFSDDRGGLAKRVAKYQQFHAVNQALAAVIAAQARGDGRGGVVWHSQGSGKSLEILFFAAKALRAPELANPTLVILTDRTNLDDQLFEEVFAAARTLPESPVQAESREHLQAILRSRASGGIVFSTIQKFGRSREDRAAHRWFPCLSDRANIIVVADEAHRTHYELIDGLARNLRDALPHAVRLGFTGTPIESVDRSTRDIFGDYIDIYDLTQSVEDGATVKVYYEPRLARVELPARIRAQIDDQFEAVTQLSEDEAKERLKNKWARVEAVVGAADRVREVARDLVDHWEQRRGALVGKGLIVCMSRRICVDLYDAITSLRPDWHADDDAGGRIKVVITGAASDGPELNRHVRNRDRLRVVETRAKDPNDPLELVIVRDMWLTGFDSPSLHTMYVDKPMQGAGLMQAIARINRTFRDKPGGLVVDYIGIAENLRAALADYTARDRASQEIGAAAEQALYKLQEQCEILSDALWGCPWREALASPSAEAHLQVIPTAVNHLLAGVDLDLPDRFLQHARLAGQVFTLCVALPGSARFRDDLAFFQAVATELRRERAGPGGDSDDGLEYETAIRQVVSDAVAAAGVIDIYAASGFGRPDIGILDDDFTRRFTTAPLPALQVELARRLLAKEVRRIGERSVVAKRKFSEMLARAMQAYNNRTLTAAEVIARLVEVAKEVRADAQRGASLGLRDDEYAFYEAVRQNDSAVLELGDDTLKRIAQELVTVVRRNATVDWDKKEQVRASLRRHVRRLLMKHKYPPDQQEAAVDLVMEQAETFAREVAHP